MGDRMVQGRQKLVALFLSPFRFLGRLGRRMLHAIWIYMGLLGAALRNFLTRIVWRPILLISRLLIWFYQKSLNRPLAFFWLSIRTFGDWFRVDFAVPVRKAVSSRIYRLLSFGSRSFSSSIGLVKKISAILLTAFRTILLGIGTQLSKTPFRLNRVIIAILITIIIIALGVIPNPEPQPEENLSLNRALAEQKPSQVAQNPPPTETARPTETSAVKATEEPIPVSSPLPTEETVIPQEIIESPDSARGALAFSLRKNGNSDIYALIDGKNDLLRFTHNPAEDREPAWSPDGQKIAFASNRGGSWDIFVLDMVEDSLTQITDTPHFEGSPSWSPDGKWLVYESYQYNNLDLYIIDSAGDDIAVRLTEGLAHDYSPAWAPGGRHIAFISQRRGNPDIYILPLDTTSDEIAVNISNTPGQAEDHPSFDQGGSNLVYQVSSDGLDLIMVQGLDNYQVSSGPRLIGQGSYPCWLAGQDELAYVHQKDDQNYIFASSAGSWNAAAHAYAAEASIDGLSWSNTFQLSGTSPTADDRADLPLYSEVKSPLRQDGAPYLIWPIEVDAPSPYLSDRVDQSFEALRDRIMNEAGWDFLGRLDNMFSPLASRPSTGESFNNWNKAGRAFDFYHRFPISLDPQVEIVREDIGPETYWRVFLRAANQDGSKGEPIRQLTWDFSARYGSEPAYYDQGGKLKDELPSGYYIDFTKLAADYNWVRVPALANWRTFFNGIRYWHFENRQGLFWEEAILEIYTEDELARVVGNP